MNVEDKISLIAEILDVPANDIQVNDSLESFESWDSMASLMLISVLEESFSRTDVEGAEISNMKTIEDIIKVMENPHE